jgi:NADPH:quinone reductase-like Zn-dependent oxidoreductase
MIALNIAASEHPPPGPKEILLRVHARSLNYRDLMVLKGGGRGPTKLGVVPLSDGAGEVAAIGAGLTRVKLGERVIGTFHPRWFGGPLSADYLTDRLGANLDGMLAEYAVLSEEAIRAIPVRSRRRRRSARDERYRSAAPWFPRPLRSV